MILKYEMGKGAISPTEMEIDHCYFWGGTAGSQKRARLLRRASAWSSLKALLAAAVAVSASEFKFERSFVIHLRA